MRPTFLALALALAPLLTASSTAAPRVLSIANDGHGYAGFRIDDTLDTIDGTTGRVSGGVRLDAENLAGSSVVLSVDVSSLDTGNEMRDAEMRRTLETKKYPFALFRSTSVIGPVILEPNHLTEAKLVGDFTLHGVTRRINVPVHLVLTPAGQILASGRFTIRMTDYDIEVPDKLIVSVANEVTLRFELTAR